MTSAAEKNYAPAQEAIRQIQSGLNAQIFTGLCDLFYYAASIIDERAEEIHAPSWGARHQLQTASRGTGKAGWCGDADVIDNKLITLRRFTGYSPEPVICLRYTKNLIERKK